MKRALLLLLTLPLLLLTLFPLVTTASALELARDCTLTIGLEEGSGAEAVPLTAALYRVANLTPDSMTNAPRYLPRAGFEELAAGLSEPVPDWGLLAQFALSEAARQRPEQIVAADGKTVSLPFLPGLYLIVVYPTGAGLDLALYEDGTLCTVAQGSGGGVKLLPVLMTLPAADGDGLLQYHASLTIHPQPVQEGEISMASAPADKRKTAPTPAGRRLFWLAFGAAVVIDGAVLILMRNS